MFEQNSFLPNKLDKRGAGWLSHYSDSLRTGRSGDRNRWLCGVGRNSAGLSPAGVVCLNPAGGMYICVMCFVQQGQKGKCQDNQDKEVQIK